MHEKTVPKRVTGRSRRSRLLTPLSVTVIALATIIGMALPAYATNGPVSSGGCVDTGKTYDTYPTAQVQYDQNSKSHTKVDYNMWSYGNTYDCGPAGRPQSVSSLKVQIVYRVSGSRIDCSGGAGIGGGGITVSFSCASNHSDTTVKESYTCHTASACHIADANVTFIADSGGSIDHFDVWGKTTITGSDGFSTASSYSHVF
jgi:hypothetical protein